LNAACPFGPRYTAQGSSCASRSLTPLHCRSWLRAIAFAAACTVDPTARINRPVKMAVRPLTLPARSTASKRRILQIVPFGPALCLSPAPAYHLRAKKISHQSTPQTPASPSAQQVIWRPESCTTPLRRPARLPWGLLVIAMLSYSAPETAHWRDAPTDFRNGDADLLCSTRYLGRPDPRDLGAWP